MTDRLHTESPPPSRVPPQLATLLAECEKADGSDLHLTPNGIPHIRIHGELLAIPGAAPLPPAEIIAISDAMMNSGLQRAASLLERGSAD